MRIARAGTVLLVAIAGATSACFPAFEFGSDDGGPPGEPDASGLSDSPIDRTIPPGPGPDAAGDGALDGALDGAPDGTLGDAREDAPTDAGADVPVSTYDAGAFDASAVALLPSGTFNLYVDRGSGVPAPVTATLTHGFEMDRYEVTVARFRAWVDGGMPIPSPGTALDPSGQYPGMTWGNLTSGGGHTWADYASAATFEPGACDEVDPTDPNTYAVDASDADYLPVNCVTWYTALAFCWWDGQKRLPTETEWRVAVSSGGNWDAGPYPWGTAAVDCSHATVAVAGSSDCSWPVPAGTASQGATQQGIFDLVGSAAEWVWDDATDSTYPDAGVDFAPGQADSGDPTSAYVTSNYGSAPAGSAMLPSQELDTGSNYVGYAGCGFRCVKSR